MSETARRPEPIRWISVAAFAAWVFLFATTYAYLSPLRHAWGLNLLRYLPDGWAWLVTGLALLFTTEEARRGAIRAGGWIADRLARLPGLARDAVVFAASAGLLWALRDRLVTGDAKLLLGLLTFRNAGRPELGEVWLQKAIIDLGGSLGVVGPGFLRAVGCAVGALAVVFTVRAARLAVPEGGPAFAIPLLALTGGVGAALAGRIEPQAFELAAAALYFWLALRAATAAGPLWAAALALGVLVWLQPFALVLLPSLFAVLGLRGARRGMWVLALVALPLAVHVGVLLALGPREPSAGVVIGRALGSARGWLGLPGTVSNLGTDYAVLGGGHLKYLANALLALAGGALALLAALPLLLRIQGASPDPGSARTPQRLFVRFAVGGLLFAMLVVRPVWGPWDWELFAVAGLALAFLAGVELARVEAGVRRQAVTAAAALQLCFFGVPLVGLGLGAPVDAGPLVAERFDPGLVKRDREPLHRIAPWL